MSLRIAIVGYGRMGRIVERLVPEHGCQVVRVIRSAENTDGRLLMREQLQGIDVAIEFTNAEAAPKNLRGLIEAGVPVVTGTTGWFRQAEEIRANVRGRADHSEGPDLFRESVRTFAFRRVRVRNVVDSERTPGRYVGVRAFDADQIDGRGDSSGGREGQRLRANR